MSPDGKEGPEPLADSGSDSVGKYQDVFADGITEGFKEVLVSRPEVDALDNLAQSERRYRRLFEAARDGILLLDVDTGRITEANPYMYELLGYSPSALLGKELWEIGLFEDREASRATFRRLHAVGYIRYEDLPLETQSGEPREVEFVSNIYRENGHTVIQCNIRDITERKRIARALQDALLREQYITQTLQHPLTMDVAEDAFPGLLLAACYEPLLKEAQVGGDFFDAFSFRALKKAGGSKVKEADMVALVVGDVIGKGVLAAALAGRVKDMVRAFLRENHDPATILTRLNDYLCDPLSNIGYRVGYSDEDSSRMTVLTLTIAIIDSETGVTAISLAGAEPPALLRADGAVEVIEVQGLLLGVQPDMSYTVRWLLLRAGDTLLMATDGITEARRTSPRESATDTPELLGHEGMLAIAQRNRAAVSLRAMSQAILQEARAFGYGFRDDVCLLLARRR